MVRKNWGLDPYSEIFGGGMIMGDGGISCVCVCVCMYDEFYNIGNLRKGVAEFITDQPTNQPATELGTHMAHGAWPHT